MHRHGISPRGGALRSRVCAVALRRKCTLPLPFRLEPFAFSVPSLTTLCHSRSLNCLPCLSLCYQTTRMIARQLVDAVAYLHERNIAHRDIKPENILLARPKDESLVKLTDFGFASEFNPNTRFSSSCGTPLYVAPEIIAKIPYDTRW